MKVLSYDPQLIAAGAAPYLLTNGQHFYKRTGPTTFDTSAVDVSVVAEAAKQSPPGQHVLIDIEEFDLKTEPELAARNIASAIWTWRNVSPSAVLGIYRTVPDLMYGATVHTTRQLLDRNANAAKLGGFADDIAAWQSRNDYYNSAFGDALDFYCPRLYAGNDWPNWKAYAHYQLIESKRLADGRPVYPIMWAVYDSLTPIPLAQWNQMIDWVESHYCIDGIMIFTHATLQGATGWRDRVSESIAR